MASVASFLMGLVLSLIIAIAAFKREMLSEDGILGALILGTLIFTFAGWTWFAVLVLFFLTSSLLTKFKAKLKKNVEAEFAKGGRRDLLQVLANGAVGAFSALASFLWPSPYWVYAFAGSIATVTADTWATELGILYNKRPLMLPYLKPVRVGTSGAVSREGTFFAALGALTIGLTLALTSLIDLGRHGLAVALEAWLDWSIPLVLIAAFAGVIGCFVDSLLGATLQATYFCPYHRKETENPIHKCGRVSKFRKGLGWIDNDIVNLASSVVGAGVAVALAALLRVV